MLIHGLPVDRPPTPRAVTGWDNGLADTLHHSFTADELAALAAAAAGAPGIAAGRGALVAQGVMTAAGGPWARLANVLAVAAQRAAGREEEHAAAT